VNPRIVEVLTASQTPGREALAIQSSPLLPGQEAWDYVLPPTMPITVNWLLTGQCPLRCIYCYAEDLMHSAATEPDAQRIELTAKSILGLQPLVVVLTGGDPLASPHIERAVSLLHGTCAVVVDTSGVGLTDSHIETFSANDVTLRVSLDSEVPAITRRQRPTASGGDSSAAALSAVCRGVDSGLTVVVQTVATQWNTPDLAYLGDKLYRLGVRLWRVFEVAPSKGRLDGYGLAAGVSPGKRAKVDGMWSHFIEDVLGARSRQWSDRMAVQLTKNGSPDSVLLVSPDGRFYTESTIRSEKVLIDPLSPRRPSTAKIRSHVDMRDHLKRYVGSRPGEDSNGF
jgi:MoaA/NifB/PqqE/SkfB family radical SAM enzyme